MDFAVKGILKNIANFPPVWRGLQKFVGASQWKYQLYSSMIKKQGVILDFGCSMGVATPVFLQSNYHGIDIDRSAILAAKNTYHSYSNISFEYRDILKDPLDADVYDDIIFGATGHHLADKDLLSIIEELFKCLAVGGEIHFFDPIIQQTDSFFPKLMARVDQGKFMRTEKQYLQLFNVYVPRTEEWKIFPSPNRFIKLQDMLYVRFKK